ncbi:MAG: chemotaxis protein CheX [Phycisphaerales bacterium]
MSHDIASMPDFVASAVTEVFSMFVDVELDAPTIEKLNGPTNQYDISAVVPLSGSLNGAIALRAPVASASAFVEAFGGDAVEPDSDAFSDAFGELANMISGSAKAKYNSSSLSIGCPTVVLAPGHKIRMPSGTVCWAVRFESPKGAFAVEIGLSAAAVEGSDWKMLKESEAA